MSSLLVQKSCILKASFLLEVLMSEGIQQKNHMNMFGMCRKK